MTSATRSAKNTEKSGHTQALPAREGPPRRLIRKMLIANRGEIACRIMRTCRAMGIVTIAVYSDADINARHVREADEAIHIGGSVAADSYLNVPALLAAASRTGADAIHPGYGFLSENADFAAACRAAGLTFVGPRTDTIARMGSKTEAKRIAASANVCVVPGYAGDDQSDDRFLAESRSVGYPLMIKASAGGGGKGMRVVEREVDLPQALAAARREARSAFGDDALLIEKLIADPRHIEVQIFGDAYGHVIQLGERECSIQRRHQKVVEETPSTALTPELRAQMTAAALAIGEQLRYDNAGTVEFILDAMGNFYFLEVNTRLQVEHPVTEFVTGLDLVRWQIRVAEGHPLPLAQDEIRFLGHAVEARLYAEVPEAGFLPASGPVLLWREPRGEGVRVESGVTTGDSISPYYDPLLAKIVAYGEDRAEALRKLERALSQTVLLGIPSNRAFLRRLILHPEHLAGQITTGFIDTFRDDLMLSASGMLRKTPVDPIAVDAAIFAAVWRVTTEGEPVRWRNNMGRPLLERFIVVEAGDGPSPEGALHVEVAFTPASATRFEVVAVAEGSRRSHSVELRNRQGNEIAAEVDGRRSSATVVAGDGDVWWVAVNDEMVALRWQSPFPAPRTRSQGVEAGRGQAGKRTDFVEQPGMVVAPLPGQVVAVHIAVGQMIQRGEPVVVLEAMKMEHIVRATQDGEVIALVVAQGDQVRHGAPLLEIRARPAR